MDVVESLVKDKHLLTHIRNEFLRKVGDIVCVMVVVLILYEVEN